MPRERKAYNKDGLLVEDGYFPRNAMATLKKNSNAKKNDTKKPATPKKTK